METRNTTAHRTSYRIDLDLGARLKRLDRGRALDEMALTAAPATNGGTSGAGALLDRQERLLEAIAANDEVVDLFLHEWAGFSIETLEHVWDDQGHEIVMSLVPSLDPGDRAFFDPDAGGDEFHGLWLGLAASTPASIVSLAVLPGATAVRPESGLAERTYRAVVVVDVLLDDIDPAAMRKLFANDFRPGDLPPGIDPGVYTRLQRALREALLRDDDALDAWLRNAAVLELAWSFEDSMLPPPADDDVLLEPVLPSLSPEDRAVYRDALDGDYVWDVAGEALLSARGWIRAVWVRRIDPPADAEGSPS